MVCIAIYARCISPFSVHVSVPNSPMLSLSRGEGLPTRIWLWTFSPGYWFWLYMMSPGWGTLKLFEVCNQPLFAWWWGILILLTKYQKISKSPPGAYRCITWTKFFIRLIMNSFQVVNGTLFYNKKTSFFYTQYPIPHWTAKKTLPLLIGRSSYPHPFKHSAVKTKFYLFNKDYTHIKTSLKVKFTFVWYWIWIRLTCHQGFKETMTLLTRNSEPLPPKLTLARIQSKRKGKNSKNKTTYKRVCSD